MQRFHKTLGFLVCAAGCLFSAYARGDEVKVSAVEVSGTKRIDVAALREQVVASAGKVAPSQVTADIKALYQTGFFDNVSAELVAEPRGTVLRYRVTEKPVVRKVFIVGNKALDQGDLSPVLQFSTNRFLDKAKIAGVIREAITLYQGRGFYDAEIEHSVVPVGDNQVDVTFTVREGPKFKIREIAFEGLKEIDEGAINGVMQTREYSWWKSWILGTGRLNREMLEADKALVRQFFLDNGYVEATIGDPKIDKVDGALRLTFVVSEGKRYSIGGITVEGDLLPGGIEPTLEGIKSAGGEFFNATKVREDSFRISEKFSNEGFAFANVIPQTNVRDNEPVIDLAFSVQKGNEVSINRIDIRGNDRTYDNVIRRELVISEQERFSGAKIKRSERLLRRLGYFEEVSVSNQPTDDPNKVDLLVNVREASTGSFSAGAGYSSADGALINARLTENNLFGTGRSASINVDVGTINENVQISLEDRRFLDTFYQLGLDVTRTDRVFEDFDRRQDGGGFTVGYPVEQILGEAGEDMQIALEYQYIDVEIANVAADAAAFVRRSVGTTTASSVTPRLTRNTIDNPLNPSSGSRQQLSFEYAGLGGSEEFYMLEARNSWYYRLMQRESGDVVFGWRFRFGYGETLDDDPMPLFRRFFPGGINTVRGFQERSLGPRDGERNEFGGSKQLINNLEVVFPLISSAGLRGLFFWDQGQAFDDEESLEMANLRQSVGYGVRWNSPLGPIRIEVGYPLDREAGEDSVVTLFAFGAPL